MNLLAMTLFGLIARHFLGGLGLWLAGQGLPQPMVDALVGLVNTLGPVGGPVAGILIVLAVFGWSYWQKHRSGALEPK